MELEKRVSISHILAHLHWLSVKSRTDNKVLTFVYKALHGLAPAYISELIFPWNSPKAVEVATSVC